MIKDGPDGHCDGHEVITDFVMALLENNVNKWLKLNGKYKDLF